MQKLGHYESDTAAQAVDNLPNYKIGTMGPSTCSAEALIVYLNLHLKSVNASPSWFKNFKQVKEALLNREIERALLPHCHPLAAELLFDPRFSIKMNESFDKPNPGLHLVTRRNRKLPTSGSVRCAALPVIWSLVSTLTSPELILVPYESTVAAAEAVASGKEICGITNDECLLRHRLKSHIKLKEVVVRWLPVILNEDYIAESFPVIAGDLTLVSSTNQESEKRV